MSNTIAQNIEKIFIQIGLTKDHARIYSCILENQLSTVAEIQKETDLKRSTIYDYLQKLSSLELIDESKKVRPTKYSLLPYQNLIDLIESDLSTKTNALDRAKQVLKEIKVIEAQKVEASDQVNNSSNYLTIEKAFNIIKKSQPKEIYIVNNKMTDKKESLISQISEIAKKDPNLHVNEYLLPL